MVISQASMPEMRPDAGKLCKRNFFLTL
jgi:hypothetical protein